MKRNIFIIMILLVITSCVRGDLPIQERPDSEFLFGIIPLDIFRPKAYMHQMRKNIPSDSEDSYTMGYQAGCQTISSAVGEGLYRLRGPKLEPDKLSNDPWYLRGYDDGTAGCFYSLDWELH